MFFDKDHLAKKYRRFLELGGGQELGRRLPPSPRRRPCGGRAAAACGRRLSEAAAASARGGGRGRLLLGHSTVYPPKWVRYTPQIDTCIWCIWSCISMFLGRIPHVSHKCWCIM